MAGKRPEQELRLGAGRENLTKHPIACSPQNNRVIALSWPGRREKSYRAGGDSVGSRKGATETRADRGAGMAKNDTRCTIGSGRNATSPYRGAPRISRMRGQGGFSRRVPAFFLAHSL
jgi:hypothetical protein